MNRKVNMSVHVESLSNAILKMNKSDINKIKEWRAARMAKIMSDSRDEHIDKKA